MGKMGKLWDFCLGREGISFFGFGFGIRWVFRLRLCGFGGYIVGFTGERYFIEFGRLFCSEVGGWRFRMWVYFLLCLSYVWCCFSF